MITNEIPKFQNKLCPKAEPPLHIEAIFKNKILWKNMYLLHKYKQHVKTILEKATGN